MFNALKHNMHTVFNAFEAQLNTTGTFCMYLLLNTLKLGSMPLLHFTGRYCEPGYIRQPYLLPFSASSSFLTECCHPPVDTADAFWLFSSCVFLVWQTLWGMIGVRYDSLWQLWGMNCMIVATCWRMIALVVDACCPFPPPDELDFVWQAQSCSHRHLSCICKQ